MYWTNHHYTAISFWKPLALFGLSLVALAVSIFVFPELLAYLIAGFLLIGGVSALSAAFALRSSENRSRVPIEWT